MCLLALAGCDRGPYGMAGGRLMQELRGPDQPQFSYSNFWTFLMPQSSIAPRFERTRLACLNDKSLHCKLMRSSIEIATENSTYSGSYASLDILLPHDKVEGFRSAVLTPVGKERAADVTVQTSTTRADNVAGESAEADRKVQQLTGYLDRLTALSKRPGLSIEDTIRLEAEISRVQGDLNAAMKAKDDVDGRVAREAVNINLNERPAGPVMSVLNRASDIFIQNVASVLSFLIGLVPWLPVIIVAVFVARLVWRLFWRRKPQGAGAP